MTTKNELINELKLKIENKDSFEDIIYYISENYLTIFNNNDLGKKYRINQKLSKCKELHFSNEAYKNNSYEYNILALERIKQLFNNDNAGYYVGYLGKSYLKFSVNNKIISDYSTEILLLNGHLILDIIYILENPNEIIQVSAEGNTITFSIEVFLVNVLFANFLLKEINYNDYNPSFNNKNKLDWKGKSGTLAYLLYSTRKFYDYSPDMLANFINNNFLIKGKIPKIDKSNISKYPNDKDRNNIDKLNKLLIELNEFIDW